MPRDLPRHTLARRGLIVLVALAVVGVLVSLRTNGTFGSSPHVSTVVAGPAAAGWPPTTIGHRSSASMDSRSVRSTSRV